MKHKPLSKAYQSNNESGYNLLMTSMTLIVIGIITVGFMQIYTLYKTNNEVTTNQARVGQLVSAMQNYKNINGRFPCPSSINAARTAGAYGVENCGAAIPVGTCSNGVCVVNGRQIAGVSQPVVIGSVPFRLLQLDEEQVYDPYGSRYLYATTQSQTSSTTYNELNGAIDIKDESGQSIADPTGVNPGSVSFVIVSPGKDRYGAFNLNGTQTIACALGRNEAANCLNLAVPPVAPYTMVSSLEYLGGMATQFDDTIEYFSSTMPSRWRRTDANQDNIQTVSNNNVGIGVTAPVVALDIKQSLARAAVAGQESTVDGALRSKNSVNVDKICDENGVNCFKTSDFTSNSATYMDCNSLLTKKYMTGIGGDGTGEHAKARCDYIKTACTGAGEVLTGFNVLTGTPICTTMGTSCAAAQVQVCNNATPKAFALLSSNQTLINPTSTKCSAYGNCATSSGAGNNAAYLNVYDQTSYVSNPAYAQFKCSAGVWTATGTKGGMCSCTPTAPVNSNCTTSPISPSCTNTTGTCPGYGTGHTTITYTYNAAACGWSGSTVNYAACTCPATPPTGATHSSTTSCVSGSNSSSWVWDSSVAVCNFKEICSCTPPPVTTRTLTTPVACNDPSGPNMQGFTGNAYKTQTFNSTYGVCGWVDSGWDKSGCTCDTGAAPFSEPTTSTCSNTCQTETTPAYNWYKYTIVAGACTKTFDHATVSVCGDKSFKWALLPSGSMSSPSHGLYPPIGQACNAACLTNNVVGQTSPCWKAGTNGNFDIFSCSCTAN